VQLTPHFVLIEFTRTSAGLPNVPDEEQVCALRALCSAVLEPLREKTGPLNVTSGFRSAAVNDELRRRGYSASKTSQHMYGEAADVVPARMSIVAAWRAVLDLIDGGLPVDQAIVYRRPMGKGWLHLSHTARWVARRQVLVDLGGGRTVPWQGYSGTLIG
jgi:zinc D-Ala-D-Ala carboxypeptidase